MTVRVLAIPYDSGHRAARMGAGPERLLAAGLAGHLKALGHPARVDFIEPPPGRWPSEVGTAFELAALVSDATSRAAAAGEFPLALAGNCNAAWGVTAGLRRAGQTPDRRRGGVWLDAHADFNTPDTTMTGFLDGMALATLAGRAWPEAARRIPGFLPVTEEDVLLLGARDLDPLEGELLASSAVRHVRPDEWRAGGAADPGWPTPSRAYLHVDLDVLDPSEGRANRFGTDGGLTLAEVRGAIEDLARSRRLAAVTLSAYDPDVDPDGRMARTAVELAGLAVGLALQAAPGCHS